MNKLFLLAGALLLTINSASAQTTWTGAAGTAAWGTNGNWTSSAPNAGVDAIIPTGKSVYPNLSTVSGTCRTLSIASGASVTVGGSRTLTISDSTNTGATLTNSGTLTINGRLTIYGSITNNATITCGPASTSVGVFNGMVEFKNTRPATVDGTGNMSMTDAKFGNAATVTFATTLSNQVKLSRVATLGTRHVYANGKLRLTSNAATTTGMIANEYGGNVLGKITVERDIDGSLNSGLGYRHYSTPVTGPTVKKLTTTGFTPIVNGTYSYPYTTTLNPFPNVFYYNEALIPATIPARSCDPSQCDYDSTKVCTYDPLEFGWVSPADTSHALLNTRGYTVRIDDGATIALTGTANNGTYTTANLGRGSNTANSGWHFLGNPYPSPISIERVMQSNSYNSGTGTGFDATVWFFRSDDDGRDVCNRIVLNGEYQFVNTVTGETSDDATQTQYLPVMQGFFVRKPAGGVASPFTFANSHRETTYPTSPILSPFYRSATPATAAAPGSAQRVTAIFRVTDQHTKQHDKAIVGFRADARAGHDATYDAVRPGDNRTAPTLYTLNQDAEACAYNALPTLTSAVVLPLVMHTLTPGHPYAVTLDKHSLPAGTRVFLDDRQTGASRELTQQAGYHFTPSSSNYDNRFVLRFEPVAGALAASTSEQASISTYPNPAQTGTPLEFQSKAVKGSTAQATLLDTFGRTITTQEVSVRNGDVVGSLSTTGVKAGIYILRLNTAGTVTTQRIQIR